MRTCWNDEEDDALQGLPLRAQVIYLRGIRRYMDYGSRVCGGPSRRISLGMLAEIVQEWLNRQAQPKASKDGVRASLEQLKRAGLIERVADAEFLVFFLPKADQDKFARNKRPISARQAGHGEDFPPDGPPGAACVADNPPAAPAGFRRHRPTHPQSINPDNSLPEGREAPPAANSAGRRAPPPYQAIVELYHESLPQLPRVYKLNETRRRRMRALWDDELEDLPSWRNYFRHIGRSDFLLGRCAGRDGQPFLASFDFIIHPAKFIKIAEEQYHGKKIRP
ncbi:MAG: hypothetical protein ABSB19_19310 [Methylomonas sp.]|jgi:hypothetical protein